MWTCLRQENVCKANEKSRNGASNALRTAISERSGDNVENTTWSLRAQSSPPACLFAGRTIKTEPVETTSVAVSKPVGSTKVCYWPPPWHAETATDRKIAKKFGKVESMEMF